MIKLFSLAQTGSEVPNVVHLGRSIYSCLHTQCRPRSRARLIRSINSSSCTEHFYIAQDFKNQEYVQSSIDLRLTCLRSVLESSIVLPSNDIPRTTNPTIMAPQGPYRLVTVNNAPERAQRLIGRVVEAVKDKYTIIHAGNVECTSLPSLRSSESSPN